MMVDIVIPVYNEENTLVRSVATLRDFLTGNISNSWKITIADNASTDSTWDIAQTLSEQYPDVACLHLDLKGRGRALAKAWSETDAEFSVYMDVDLSTDLAAVPEVLPCSARAPTS